MMRFSVKSSQVSPCQALGNLRTGVAWSPCYHFPMIESFADQASEDIFNGVNSREARSAFPQASGVLQHESLINSILFNTLQN